jgi:signal transduction histidine kinase
MVILDIQERSSWMLVAEAGAWKQILMNLFGNALKYTEEGYVKVSLSSEETETSAGGAIRPMVSLTVKYSYCGIVAQVLAGYVPNFE